MRVLCVAEKPSIAKAITAILSGGRHESVSATLGLRWDFVWSSRADQSNPLALSCVYCNQTNLFDTTISLVAIRVFAADRGQVDISMSGITTLHTIFHRHLEVVEMPTSLSQLSWVT